jgi:hypothetical protein
MESLFESSLVGVAGMNGDGTLYSCFLFSFNSCHSHELRERFPVTHRIHHFYSTGYCEGTNCKILDNVV